MNIKNNKAFTLVELLSVIALLATIAIIVIPNIDTILNNSKEKLYSKQISIIQTAAKLWATEEENLSLLESNTNWPFVLTLNDLQTAGFIDKDIIDPTTDSKIPESLLIYINKEYGKYIYSVDEISNDSLAPTITINGEKVVTLEINNNYSDAGATAIKPDGTSSPVTTVIKKRGVSSSISNNEIVTYTITYSSEYTIDDITHKAIAVRVLKYVDTTKPVITCSSCINGTVIESTDNYTLPSVTVTDNSGERLTAIITGSFSSKIPGNKKVIYQATDSSGNTGILEVSYVVKDTIVPTFIYQTTDINRVEVIATDSGSGIKDYSFDSGKTWQSSNVATIACGNSGYIKVRDNALNEASKQFEIICYQEWNYAYTGDSQDFIAIKDGWYQIELWGAQGGSNVDAEGTVVGNVGGLGAYTAGTIYLSKSELLNINIGGIGGHASLKNDITTKGYNGGGMAGYDSNCGTSCMKGAGGGGGATDIRYNGTSLNDRIMVAGGGGGAANWYSPKIGGAGGSLIGGSGQYYSSGSSSYTNAEGGAQNTGGNGASGSSSGSDGIFGVGGDSSSVYGGGGGGGYYGGGGGSFNSSVVGSGAGGSSFISGYAGVNAITSSESLTPTNNTLHYSGKYFIDGQMSDGINEGNGKAKVTYISLDEPKRLNSKLNGVRYIKDCATGNASNGYVYWDEIQAIKNGVNIAYGKTVTGTVTSGSQPYSKVTDGNEAIRTHANTSNNSQGTERCVTIDLGKSYDLDEIAVWHLANEIYPTYQPHRNNYTSVSSDNTNWIKVINTGDVTETSDGKRVNAFSTIIGYSDIYLFNYTGKYNLLREGTRSDWKIKFLTSGILTVNKDVKIDAFLVGGGGSGGYYYGSGGGGGYTTTLKKISLLANNQYNVVIGNGGTACTSTGNGSTGGTTTAFEISALGGMGGGGSTTSPTYGGNGGSGGGGRLGNDCYNGGSNGSDGLASTYGGKGQGTTTCEFEEGTLSSCNEGVQLYSGGGGAGGAGTGGAGGLGGGGHGTPNTVAPLPNSGGGSGGDTKLPGADGIVVIRNSRDK